jgi:hypothetical protein
MEMLVPASHSSDKYRSRVDVYHIVLCNEWREKADRAVNDPDRLDNDMASID